MASKPVHWLSHLTAFITENLLTSVRGTAEPNYVTDLRQPPLLPERAIKSSSQPLMSPGDLSFVYSSALEFVSSRMCTHTSYESVCFDSFPCPSPIKLSITRDSCVGRGAQSSVFQSRQQSGDSVLIAHTYTSTVHTHLVTSDSKHDLTPSKSHWSQQCLLRCTMAPPVSNVFSTFSCSAYHY